VVLRGIHWYIDGLKVLNQQGGDAADLGNKIQTMFGMMSSQYNAFCTLKKEFEKVDKTFKNNLDIVKEMCQPPSPFKGTKSSPQPISNVAPATNDLTAMSGDSEI